MSDEKPTKRRPSKKDTAERKKENMETVVQLFGKAPIVEDPPMDPDGIRPVNRGRASGSRRKQKVSVGARMADLRKQIDDGTITMKDFVATLTPEELVRGQLKAHDGTFKGRPPRWVPQEFYQACIRELLNRGEQQWREAFLDSISVFADIARDESLDAKDRIKAAQYIVERVSGKVPDRIEVAAVEPWEQIIGGIVAEAEDEAISRASRVLNGE